MKNKKTFLLSLLASCCFIQTTFAQYCTPIGNCNSNDYIDDFTFNTISNLNSAGSNCDTGYINTGLSTTVTDGQRYTISMQSGAAYAQGFGVWIDYNQDDDFDDANEFVYATTTYSLNKFTDSIIINAGGVTGTTRMRVRCKYNGVINSTESCSTFTYGETEDYNVTIQPNTTPPAADFTADVTITCNGVVNFTDLSLSIPTSWKWNFGDGNSDTVKNPTHTYAAGTYTVTLIVNNAFGSDTLIKNNYIIISGNGPVAASCTPGTTAYNYQMGIYKVTFGTINNTTADGADGYKDYSCTQQTNVLAGTPNNISIQTGTNYNETVRAWIDYDSNGVFNTVTELVFSSDNKLTNHSGSISIPANAPLNVPLRMRIASDGWSNVSYPCTNSYYGQFEDYAIIVLPNTNPPVADFKANITATCNGTVNFTDLSYNIPTSWKWNFGDGGTDTLQNPTHTYSADGNYTVTLIADNAFGSDTIIKTNYINVTLIPVPGNPSCTPATSSYNPTYQMGIYKVTFGTINNTTADGIDGYKDYTCTQQTNITVGVPTTITIQTGTLYNETVRVWIDYDTNGVFNTVTELAFSSNNIMTNHSGTITIPGTAVLNSPLRMRIGSDGFGNTPSPCTNVNYGQFEDYTVTALPNTNPPAADFSATPTITCTGIVNFTDLSINVPTSWKWNFGDGNTDTVQNPIHTYSSSDTFTVTLIAINTYGSDTIIKPNYIIVKIGGQPDTASCTPSTIGYCCGMGIYKVKFGSINNTTPDGVEGYKDYTCSQQTSITQGMPDSILITTGISYSENVRVWIDYNNDGAFDTTTELVFSSLNKLTNHSGIIIAPGSSMLNTALRMRVASDYNFQAAPLPCVNVQYGQFEDYTVIILPNTNPPVANFSANKTITCDGVISFTDLSFNVPTSWKWNFGDGGTDTVQNPTHTYMVADTYSVTLITSNAFGSDTITKINFINAMLTPVPVAASCTPITYNPDTINYKAGIFKVTFNTISNTSLGGIENYKDYSCAYQTNITVGVPTAISIQTGTTYQENVRVWLDADSNGIFNDTTELVFSSNNKLLNHTGTITILPTAVLNTPLRMRVGSDIYFYPPPTSCSNVYYGQFEDYTVIALPNTNPPVANFGANKSTTCDGVISFSDSSYNIPTSWKWTFGDGGTSTLQNPTHTYTATGTYTVTLIATNAFGSDTFTITNFINVAILPIPVAASCTPVTISYSGLKMGIYNVTFNTINNTTADGIDGYKDYTCSHQTSITAGVPTAIAVKTGLDYDENVRVWIDYNNDGVLNDTTELAFSSDNVRTNHSGEIIIPKTAITNSPLRMRVGSDYWGYIPSPCIDATYGQFEDYTVIALPNTNPPTVNFGADVTTTCDGAVQFIDSSYNFPTSWKWNFGDGGTSTLQNPSHTYSSSGYYTVTLIATNTYGSDTIIKTSFINVTLVATPIAASCIPDRNSTAYDLEVHNFTFANINNNTPINNLGYEDFTCSQQIYVLATKANTISIQTGPWIANARVWIDFNNNGVIDTTNERVYNFLNKTTTAPFTGSITISDTVVKFTPLRMRVVVDAYNPGIPFPTPCGPQTFGQAEDYTINVYPSNSKPIADFTYSITNSCNGVVQFTDKSVLKPTAWSWDFGDGIGTSTQQSPTYTYKSVGTFTVRLIATNANGKDTTTRSVTVNPLIANFGMPGLTVAKGDVVNFTDSSIVADTWSWTFGDGGTSTLQNPTHTYTTVGSFTVRLTVTNTTSGCSANKSRLITVIDPSVGINDINSDYLLTVFPNPSSGNINVLMVFDGQEDFSISIINILGQEIFAEKINDLDKYKRELNLSQHPKGIYLIKIKVGEKTVSRKIIIE